MGKSPVASAILAVSLRPQVKTLPAGPLPRFEMKSRRFFINKH